jgi:hypothetical protein
MNPFTYHPLVSVLALTDELAEALHRHGITLPSLSPDLASCTATTAPRPLIELGRVNVGTARRMVDVLKGSPEVVVMDERTGRVGVVMGAEGPYLQLRPLGGGREWDADPARVRLATAEERLNASVDAANARSRQARAAHGAFDSPDS